MSNKIYHLKEPNQNPILALLSWAKSLDQEGFGQTG